MKSDSYPDSIKFIGKQRSLQFVRVEGDDDTQQRLLKSNRKVGKSSEEEKN